MTDSFSYEIRPAVSSDQAFLWEMLYQSLHVEGQEPYPVDVLDNPNISRYVKEWGRMGDSGFIAVDARNGQPIGAVWSRLSSEDDKGYAYIDERTPELGIALLPQYRGQGIGTALLERHLEAARELYPSIALSVAPTNPAIRLYERAGFEIVDVRNDHPVMKKELGSRPKDNYE